MVACRFYNVLTFWCHFFTHTVLLSLHRSHICIYISAIHFYECANTLKTESISELHKKHFAKNEHADILHTIKLLWKTNACTTPYHLVLHYLFSYQFFSSFSLSLKYTHALKIQWCDEARVFIFDSEVLPTAFE